MDYAFPKERRLLQRRDFRLVYDQGTPYRNTGFHLFVHPRQDDSATRLGLTATRRLGNSVARNRARRRARETFRLLSDRLRPGYDLVLNFHTSLANTDRQEFDRLFIHVLRKAHLLES